MAKQGLFDQVRDFLLGHPETAGATATTAAPAPDTDPAPDALPDFAALTAAGASARDLRAHSDTMWNEAVNDWVAAHLAWTDIEVEAKFKNIASHQLAERVRAMRRG